MKSFLSIKFLTVVIGLIVTLSSAVMWGEGEDVTEKSYEECMPTCMKEYKEKCAVDFKNDAGGRSTCESRARSECEATTCGGAEKLSAIKNRCNTAFKAYADTAPKSQQACAAFTGNEEDKTCSSRIRSCREKIKNLTNPFDVDADDTSSSGGLSIIKDIALQQVYSKAGIDPTTINQTGTKCVKSIDSKQARQDKKEKDREKKELEKDIKKEYDEIAKLKEKEREKQDEIKKKVQDLEEQNKKDAADKNVKIREQIANISKNTVEVGKRLRGYVAAITQEEQKRAKANFDYQTAMLELATSKINQKCKSEFESLKGAIAGAQANDPSATTAEQKQLTAYVLACKKKGVSCNGELTEMLKTTKKACFEKANTQKNSMNLNHSQNLKNAQDRIDELKKTIEDEKTRLAQDQENMKKIQDENTQSLTDAEKAKFDKLTNLNQELQNFATSTLEKTQLAQAQIKKINEDIAKLALATNLDAQTNYDDAVEAIDKSEVARVAAEKDCGCDADPVKIPKGLRATCSTLLKNAVSLDEEEQKAIDAKKKKIKDATKN